MHVWNFKRVTRSGKLYRALNLKMTSELWNVDYFEMRTVGWRANLVLSFC